MKLHCIAIGRTSIPYVADGAALYARRIARYCDFLFRCLDTPKGWSRLPKEELMRREGDLLLKTFEEYDLVVLLDEQGKQLSSPQLADQIARYMMHGPARIAYAIGGAYGFSPQLKNSYTEWLSLSNLTYSHQLVRVVLLEQIYRAFTIIRGEPYHHA